MYGKEEKEEYDSGPGGYNSPERKQIREHNSWAEGFYQNIPKKGDEPPEVSSGESILYILMFLWCMWGYSNKYSGYTLVAIVIGGSIGTCVCFAIIGYLGGLRYGWIVKRCVRGVLFSFCFTAFFSRPTDVLFVQKTVVGFVIGYFLKEFLVISVCGGILWYLLHKYQLG